MSEFSNIKALIIEDDNMSINVLGRLLEKLSVHVEVISDSINVRQHLEEVSIPDVIFLDLEMPRNNGYTVLEMLLASSDFAKVPVVAYTTHVSHLNEAQDAGFHSFLSKPLDGSVFEGQLRRILNDEPVWEVN